MFTEKDYGETDIGQWLAEQLAEVGAPEGWSLAAEEIVDTGSALELKPSEYQGRLYAYVVAERPPDLEHDSVPHMQMVGQNGDFTVYQGHVGVGESYLARGSSWQLGLTVFPQAGDTVEWRSETAATDWINEMLSTAEREPPPACES